MNVGKVSPVQEARVGRAGLKCNYRVDNARTAFKLFAD